MAFRRIWQAVHRKHPFRRPAPRAVGLSVALVLALQADADAAPNPVQVENARPGTSAWDTVEPSDPAAISGYASQVSAAPGETVALHVSTQPAARYRVEVYRLGWYQGLGGRQVLCLPSCDGDQLGAPQPIPAPDSSTGLNRAGWPVTGSIPIGSDWVSGYYELRLLLTSGPRAGQSVGVPLIVRAAPSGPSAPIVVQASVNTWQAYNAWGGKSLYAFNSSGGRPAAKVSFDRPYGASAQSMFDWEYSLVRFLERRGYDASYTTDVDTAREPAELRRHRLVIANGHDEYWSKSIRDGFEDARSAGTNLAFLGADIADWQVRYEDDARTLVEYRTAAADPGTDPAQKTDRFGSLTPPRPQCSLLGIQYQGMETESVHDYAPVASALAHQWFDGTGMAAGGVLKGVVGYEWDGVKKGCEIPLKSGTSVTTFFHYAGDGPSADAVTYTAPSGARVFSTGTLQWNWALDQWGHPGFDDPRVQRFTENVFDDLGVPPTQAPDLPSTQPPIPTPVQPPDTSIASGPPQLTNDRSPAFTFSSEAPAGFECKVDSSGWEACSSPTAYADLPDGPHSFQVRAKDRAGNVDATPATWGFSVDGTAPDTAIVSGPSILISEPWAIFELYSEAGTGFECKLDSGGWEACSSPKVYLRLADGAHMFQARARDLAGNLDPTPASDQFSVGVAPLPAVITSGPRGTTRDRTPTFRFRSSEAGMEFECRLDTSAYSPCRSPRTLSRLAAGRHIFRVRVRAPAQGPVSRRSFTVIRHPRG